MGARSAHGQQASPTRLLEILTDRFGALEAVANSTIKLARVAPENDLAMDLQVADAVLQFGDDLRDAREAAAEWALSLTPRSSH